MDKSWIGTNRTNKSYVDGVAAFIDYAVDNLEKMRNINLRVNKEHLLMPCPCTKCLNHIEHKVEEVQFQLFRNRIDLSYTNWIRHGEKDEPSISSPKPVNATTEFVDDTDFALDIPTYGPTTVEMAWRTINEKFPKIFEDPRNLRLGISADRVDVNTGNRHHKPLLDDLHTLFETGVDTYDVSTKDNFNLRAIVLWTINDYPALGTLCGCPYSGIKGCVVCGKDTNCVRLSSSSKQSYVGHIRYLPYKHLLRKQKKAFNGQQEFLPALIPITEEQIYNEKRNTTEEEGSSSQVNRQNDPYRKKFNIWYQKLRYWRHNSVPYCIDFMHVEKNVAKSLVGTLLHVPRKSKDGVNARLDLAELGIKPELFAMQEEDKTTLPPSGYRLTNVKKDTFCETLHNIRVPQGYCSNFSSLVNLKDRKLIGLKSHDYHMLMQEFLPIAIRSIMHPPIRYAIIRFFFFFKSICSKEIILQELDKMQAELVVKMCLLKKFFPLSFFDIMIHLTVHLTREETQASFENEKPAKGIAFLENEHSKSFAKWLRKEVERVSDLQRKYIINFEVIAAILD
nr:hypothetical protein [Tanacetum cinerariifolium]